MVNLKIEIATDIGILSACYITGRYWNLDALLSARSLIVFRPTIAVFTGTDTLRGADT